MAHRARALCGLWATALVASVFAAPGFGASRANGIDLSRWNRVTSWTRVAAGGYRFVVAKASDGASRSDFTYPSYRADASAVGLKLGAYHFARPAGKNRVAAVANAVAQADHFLAVAQPRASDLLPVLDLEKIGGLTPPLLISWTSAWLQEVSKRLHARPLVYTSPRFWQKALSDTPAFAASGYSLWLARWTTVPDPFVPAQNWAGLGWTFWQWTSCGHVGGIRGCVDLDRFNGPSLSSVLVRAAPTSVSPPTIVGFAQLDQTLTAARGGWQGTIPVRFAYAWERCDAEGANCLAITGATGTTYTLGPPDVGSTIAVVVTATNAIGSTSATSLPSPVIVAS